MKKTYNSELNLSEKKELYNQTIIFLKKAIVLNPNDENAYLYLGIIYFRLLNYSEAKRYLEKAYNLSPNNFDVNLNLGKIYMNFVNDYETARKYFEKSINLNPKSGDPLFNLGFIYYYQKNYDLSLQALKKGIELEPTFWKMDDVYSGMGVLYTILNKPSDAEEAAKKAIELQPTRKSRAIDHLTLSRVFLYYNNEYEKAEKEFKKALEIDPDISVLHNELGWVYYKKLEYNKSIYEFNKYLNSRDANDTLNKKIVNDAYFGLALSYFEIGDHKNAKIEFNKTSTDIQFIDHGINITELISKIKG
jgi:tetratricopeptide (TPR) repeat protein